MHPYNELIFRPLYNGLIGIMDIAPWLDVGIAVIIFTAIVKLILYPLSKSALLTQVRMKEIEPEAARIRTQYPDRQVQAQKLMELYKTKKVKPFAGVLLLIIQIPVLLALISVFYKVIPTIDASLLYSFVSAPVNPNTMFLGLIDLTQKSLILAIITAVVQFLQLHFSLASKQAPAGKDAAPAGAAQMATNMTKQMKYFVPILAFASIYWIIPAQFPKSASIIALYWMTSSLMTFLQELYVRKQLERSKAVTL